MDAVRELLSHPEFVQRSSKGEWPLCIEYSAFVEVPTPDCAEGAHHEPEAESSRVRAERRRQSFRIV